MRLSWWAVTALLTLPGCATSASRMSSSLGGTIIATESTQEGKALRLPEAGITEVDVNSAIHLQMNADEIRAELYRVAEVDPSESRRIADALEEVRKLIALHEQVIAKLTELTRLAKTLDHPIPENEFRKLGDLERQIEKDVSDYVERRGESAERLWETPGYVGVERYLDERKREALAEHERLVARLSGVRWRVQASLGSGASSLPINLRNYDTHQPGAPHLVNKLMPIFGNEERAQLAKAKELTATVAKLGKSTDAWMAELGQLAKQTGESMASLVTSIHRELPMLRDDIRRAGNSTPQAKELAKAIEAGFAERQSLMGACGKVVERMGGLPSSKDPFFVTIGLYGGAAECRGLLRGEGVRQYLLAIRDSANEMASHPSAESPLLARVKTAAELEGKLAKLLDNWKWLDKAGEYTGLQQPDPTDAPRFTDRAHDEIVDTTIDLVRTPRSEGDLLTYQAAVVIDDEVVRAGAPVHLRVVRNGMRVNVSAAAFFVRPNDFVEGKEPEFSPAPAVTAAVHYRFARADFQAAPTGWARLWNVLDPGIGLHFATPVLAKKNETSDMPTASGAALGFGLGTTVQLFGDVAQVGIGYDFQAGRSYALVGIGLQTLTDFGATFPAGAGGAER